MQTNKVRLANKDFTFNEIDSSVAYKIDVIVVESFGSASRGKNVHIHNLEGNELNIFEKVLITKILEGYGLGVKFKQNSIRISWD